MRVVSGGLFGLGVMALLVATLAVFCTPALAIDVTISAIHDSEFSSPPLGFRSTTPPASSCALLGGRCDQGPAGVAVELDGLTLSVGDGVDAFNEELSLHFDGSYRSVLLERDTGSGTAMARIRLVGIGGRLLLAGDHDGEGIPVDLRRAQDFASGAEQCERMYFSSQDERTHWFFWRWPASHVACHLSLAAQHGRGAIDHLVAVFDIDYPHAHTMRNGVYRGRISYDAGSGFGAGGVGASVSGPPLIVEFAITVRHPFRIERAASSAKIPLTPQRHWRSVNGPGLLSARAPLRLSTGSAFSVVLSCSVEIADQCAIEHEGYRTPLGVRIDVDGMRADIDDSLSIGTPGIFRLASDRYLEDTEAYVTFQVEAMASRSAAGHPGTHRGTVTLVFDAQTD